MCGKILFSAVWAAFTVCVVILVQAGDLPAMERLSVAPNRPHVILAGDRPIFLAGYYEAPDDAEPRFPSMNYFLDRNAQYGCNTFRLPFALENESGPYNPYCPYSAWNNNDCGQPNEDYYDNFLRPFCSHARELGIYVVICLYPADTDWPCTNKTDANRKLTYDKILEHTYDLKNVIIETNWEVPEGGLGRGGPEGLLPGETRAFLYDVADYIQNHPDYPGVLAIVTDWHFGNGAHLGPNKINGRHRSWDRPTSIKYWDENRATLWTERWFFWPGSDGPADMNPKHMMTEKEARANLYRDALFCGSGIQFYYTRWNASGHPGLSDAYLKQCGYAIDLSEMIPLADMAPEERVACCTNNGHWLIDPGKCYAGYLEDGGNVTVNLSDVSGRADYFWFNPRDGSITGEDTVSGGENRDFSAPDSDDWVLVIKYKPACGDADQTIADVGPSEPPEIPEAQTAR